MTQSLKQQIIDIAAPDLAKVEAALEKYLEPNLSLVRQIASHLLFGGGKRLRPLLMIHSARICGYDKGSETDFSIIFEYLHAATLLHDDVVDGADVRRGRAAAHTRWAAPKVVLTGDFLLARALDIAARTKSPEIISVIARITRDMSQGEIDQLEKKAKLDLTETEYLEVIDKKTAVLIEGACRSGAILAGADADLQDALGRFGHHLGMAFQMADDLLDYTADAGQLGKNPGADMREGKLTLPLIYSLDKASDADQKWMHQVIKDPGFDPDNFEKLKEKLEQYGGIAYTRQTAQAHADQAKRYLDDFAAGPSKQLLTLIAEYSVQRKV